MLYSRKLASRGIAHGFIPAGQPLQLFGEARGIAWEQIVSPKQVHGDCVLEYNEVASGGPADGVWARADGPLPVLGIRTADCVPVLLANTQGDVAAIHAGWRGTVLGIVEKYVKSQEQLGIKSSSWICALGPAADGCCYEVGPEVFEGLGFRPRRGNLDLREVLEERLGQLGVVDLERVGPCTICGSGGDTAWASYRRQGTTAGRNLALISPKTMGNQ